MTKTHPIAIHPPNRPPNPPPNRPPTHPTAHMPPNRPPTHPHAPPNRPPAQSYNMDFGALIDYHRARGADVTVASTPADEDHAEHLGILKAR